MQIKAVTVENFKSFEKLTLADLLSVNMIFGYNNSGKSNLFKFLELVFSSNDRRVYVTTRPDGKKEYRRESQEWWKKTIVNQPFIFRRIIGEKVKDITFSIEMEISRTELNTAIPDLKGIDKLLPGTPEKYSIIFEGVITQAGDENASMELTKITLGGTEVWNSTVELVKDEEESQLLDFNDFTSIMNIFSDCVLLLDNDRYFVDEIESAGDAPLTAKNYKNEVFNMSLSRLKVGELKRLASFLKSFHLDSTDPTFSQNELSSPFVDFGFEFARIGDEKIEVMLVNKFGRFPISSFGTGIQQIIYILSKIFLAHRNKIVLIEELELNLSPKYQSKIIQFIDQNLIKGSEKYIGQFFYTTHSPLMSYRTEYRTLWARIDQDGKSSIEEYTATEDEVKTFKAAIAILETYRPAATDSAKAKATVKSASAKP